MKLVDLAKLARLDNLIRHAATGEPGALAKRLGMSRSNLFEMLSFMKEEMNAPVIYNRNRPSYVYAYTPKFYLGFEQERLNSTEITSTYGGGDEKMKRSKCNTCRQFQECFDRRNRCWADIIKAYGGENWDFPDPRCSKAPKMTYNLAFYVLSNLKKSIK